MENWTIKVNLKVKNHIAPTILTKVLNLVLLLLSTFELEVTDSGYYKTESEDKLNEKEE